MLRQKHNEDFDTLKQMMSTRDILTHFSNSVDKVYFNQDLTEKGKKVGQNLIVIFSIKKPKTATREVELKK